MNKTTLYLFLSLIIICQESEAITINKALEIRETNYTYGYSSHEKKYYVVFKDKYFTKHVDEDTWIEQKIIFNNYDLNEYYGLSMHELNNEKIDIVNYSEQPEILITRALSPAKPVNLYIDEEKDYCIAIFEDENLDSAIGRNGMNINLASRVTGYRIDAYGANQYKRLQNDQNTQLIEISGITNNVAESLKDAGIRTVSDLMDADEESLLEIKGIASSTVEKIYSSVQHFIERDDFSTEEKDSEIDNPVEMDEEE